MPKNDEERYRKEQVRRAIEKTHKNREIFIKFPFIVAGELMNNLCSKYIHAADKKEVIGDFFEVLDDDKIDLIPAKADALKLAAEIKGRDNLLGDTDLLIIAQALCDIYSTNLLTSDKKIIESQEIDSISRDMAKRLQKLKISEGIR
ncbi:MAG: hypothetical protein WCP70_15505 [Methanothrix sp.]